MGEEFRRGKSSALRPLTHCITLAKAFNLSVSLTLLRNIYYLPGITGGLRGTWLVNRMLLGTDTRRVEDQL